MVIFCSNFFVSIRRLFFSLGILALPAIALAQSPTVITESGALSGVGKNGLSIYMGVPFAAPPLGDLRWRAPAPVAPWTGTRKADAFAPACMQEGVSMPGEAPPTVSEDCLYLNVWTPAKSAHEHLPVLVWIYGGGYTNGSASMPLYWGDQLAQKGVLVVTIAYRVGPLGFLALPELTRESGHQSSGNYGLMDQLAALEWIHRNISAFGGDAKNLTIAGQSAGSMCVSILMASPRAAGLFQRAIGESGGLFEPVQLAPRYLLANAEHDGEKYALSLNAPSVKQLRQLPAAALLKGSAGDVSHPVIEPYVLPVAPFETFTAGKQNDVPLLLGSNAEEARALVDISHVTNASFNKDLASSVGALPPPLVAAYPHATDQEAQQAMIDLQTDLRFGWDMWAWARLQAATGKNPVFYYSFRQKPPFPAGSVYDGWGASHFSELWYVFNHQDQSPWSWSAADRKLADEMSSYWVNFVISGDPNTPHNAHKSRDPNSTSLPTWPPFTDTESKVLYLADPITVGGVSNINGLKIFDAIYASLRPKPPVVAGVPAAKR
jgi:para-nitrobenzyl esterase